MLEISLLGEIIVHWQGKPITHFRSQKEVALLAYLAHTGQTHSREALADLLWEASSTKQSLSNLRTIIARLRQQMGDDLIIMRKTMGVVTAVHTQTDSVQFQTLLASLDTPQSTTIKHLQDGLALYRGELMAGFYLSDAPRFNDWLVVEQERLRQIALRGCQQLAHWQEEQGAFDAGVRTAQQWVNWDPLDEAAQQQLMRLLAFAGRNSEALAIYETYRQLLQTELTISPTATTATLYAAIQQGSLPPPTPRPPHNLPRALTPLFGRQKEIAKLTSNLVNPDYPLISLTGIGGIGKTSLALAAGRQLLATDQHPFKDGIWFVPLEEIENDTPEKVRNRVAALVGQALGLYFQGESDLWSQLLTRLAAKQLLLILDNIEQFLTVASDLILALLEAGDNIQLLVTSRTTLALNAAIAFHLTGLETPAQVSTEALQNESVRLFAARAAQMPTPFQLEKHLAEVVAICQFVRGMPLAIELAAGSLARLMVAEIMPALTNNLHLLNSTWPDLPPRQRTLCAVFEATWQLLDTREQSLLAQISVFRGGFTREAAAAVLNDANSGLYNLQHHALLNRDETGRFRMHPLLRQLAREKLSDPTMTDLAKHALQRHSRYFADFMGGFADELERGVAKEALQAILPEQANLRAAWQQLVYTEQWLILANCLDGYHYFYERKGLFIIEAVLVDEAIDIMEATMAQGDVLLNSLLSRLLTVRARDYLAFAQHEKGLRLAERACKLAQKIENANIEAQARYVFAGLLFRNHAERAKQYEQVIALAQVAQNPNLEADGWSALGAQFRWLENANAAEEPLHKALDLYQAGQHKPGEMQVLFRLSNFASAKEDYALAVTYNEQALQLSYLLDDLVVQTAILGNLGNSFRALGDLIGAQRYQNEALIFARQLNMPTREQVLLGELGVTAIRLGDYATAKRQLDASWAIATQFEDAFWQAWVKLQLAEMWFAEGESKKALALITEAFQTAEQAQTPHFLAAVLYHWGNVLLGQEDWDQAEQKFQRAYDLWQGAGRAENATHALAGLACVAYRQEMPVTAAAHAEQLWQIWQAEPSWAERADMKVYWMLGMVWDGLEDSRANDVWKKAHALLQERSEKIPDEAARQIFLENVPAHRAILQLPI